LAITRALEPDHTVVFVDDPTPLTPSPYPDVAVSWDWGNGGALLGLSRDANALNVRLALNNGERGTDILVSVGWSGSTWEVLHVGQPARWVT